MDEAAAVELATRLRPELPSLLETEDALRIDEELTTLIERGREGEPVAVHILRLLRTHPALRRRAAEMGDPDLFRGVQPPPGKTRPPMPPRYVCPNDGYEWFRLDVATPVPACPRDGAALVLTPAGDAA